MTSLFPTFVGPCGGTHVKKTSELGKITVTRIKKVKKTVKVYYELP